MSIEAAISIARRAISGAPSDEWAASARAAPSAAGEPEPIAAMPSSGSIRSPVPETR
jgi:hypothetical protein